MHYVILGDVHLTREYSAQVARDLSALVAANRGATLVFAGDLFDLAAETVRCSATEAVRAVLGAHPALRSALGAHLAAGGEVMLLRGNHDDELVTDEGFDAFADALALAPAERARVHRTPWFARLGEGGALHVEHGHHYDPDNTQPHPLAPPDPAWRSLGIGLMHAFVVPSGAHAIVHANDREPLAALWRTFELFGPRAPEVIVRYFLAAGGQLARAGRRYPSAEGRARGDEAVEPFAARWGLDPAAVRALIDAGATPRLASRRDTFLRLYWDRVFATAVASVAGTSALLGGPGKRVAAVSAGVLVASIVAGRNRYRGRVNAALIASAEQLVAGTGARSVVFGHIHAPDSHGAYKNTGSFAFPGDAPGRPYVRVDARGSESERMFYKAA